MTPPRSGGEAPVLTPNLPLCRVHTGGTTLSYFVNLFSPDSYKAFSESDRTISGFSASQETRAGNIGSGYRFVCYRTKLSRWIGVLEAEDDCAMVMEYFSPGSRPRPVRSCLVVHP